jgi:signal peptidase II
MRLFLEIPIPLFSMSKNTKIIFFIVCCIAFIGCDRVTKNLAKQHLKDQAEQSYFNGTLRLMYVENTGAALSLGDGLSKTASFWLLSILPLVFLLAVLFYAYKHLDNLYTMRLFCIAMIFSGGIGNIVDRILFDRHVTDFMLLSFGSLHTGIFNVADVCVTAGVIGLLLFRNKLKPQNTAA